MPVVRFSAIACVLAACGAPLSAQPAKAPFHATYTVSVKDTTRRLLHVSARFTGVEQKTLDLALPVWTPGWYTLEYYAKNVARVTVSDGAGHPLPAQLVKAQTWRVDTRGAHQVVVDYDYWANVVGLNQAKLTGSYAFFTGTELLLEPGGHRNAPATLRLEAPPSWKTISALAETGRPNEYTAPDYDVLIDAPCLMGAFDVSRFEVEGKPHALVVVPAGLFSPDSMRRYTAHVSKIVATASAIFGGLPYDKYLFFDVLFDPETNAAGGLEHLNSFVIVSSYRELSSAGMSGVAHEFFHLWNVKRIRPAEMWPYDYSRPAETPSLWWSEGVTDYYGSLIALRAGELTDSAFLAQTARTITGLENNPARSYVSPADASMSTFTGYDTPTVFQISYYGQGQVLGTLLDLSLQRDTRGRRRLDDVVRELYTRFYQRGRGFTPDDLVRTVSDVAGRDYRDFFRRYVRGTDVPPYDSIFATVGLRVERDTSSWRDFGVYAGAASTVGVPVVHLFPGAPAATAGVQEGDTVSMIDGVPISDVKRAAPMYYLRLQGGGDSPARVTLLHNGERRMVVLTPRAVHYTTYRLVVDPSAPAADVAARARWLAASAPRR